MVFVPERDHFGVIVAVTPECMGVEIAAIPLERVIRRQNLSPRPGLASPAMAP